MVTAAQDLRCMLGQNRNPNPGGFMSQEANSNSSVGIVAIVAVLILAGAAAWFVWGRSAGTAASPKNAVSAPANDADIHVKIDLPDSVVIK